MARMFPERVPEHALNDPKRSAEVQVYELLKSLPDSYRVFYSVAWLGRRRDGGSKDGEADFVVAHPVRGILILEVKGGVIAFDGHTGEWSSTDRGGRVHAIQDPVAQARNSKHALLRKLKSLPELKKRFLEIGHGVVFPHCSEVKRGLKPDVPAQIVLCDTELRFVDEAISAIYDHWMGEHAGSHELGDAGCQAIEKLLAPTFELRRTLGQSVRHTDKQFITLTEKQFRILDQLSRNRRMAVCGGAGTGKSLLALEKARRLANEGFRTLLTCFNRPLSEYVRTCVEESEDLHIDTFHQLCSGFSQEAGCAVTRPSGASGAEAKKRYFDEELPEALTQAFDRKPELRFDAIVVDEGQDFAENWWMALQMGLNDPDHGICYVFYDDNQRIYRPHTGFPATLPAFSLTENVRNTRSIHSAAARYYGGPELVAIGPRGEPVEFVRCQDSNDCRRSVVRVLHRLITQESIPPGDIALLSGYTKHRSKLVKDKRIDVFPVQSFHEKDPHKVVYDSVHRFKGLESPVVVLAEIAEVALREDLLYVAFSRARSHLIVVCDDEIRRRLATNSPRA